MNIKKILLSLVFAFLFGTTSTSWAWFGSCCSNAPTICNNAAPCGPYLRPLSDDYDSYKDNTKMVFIPNPPCAPRNDSSQKGYLYKGMFWDVAGVRYWAIRNSTNNLINVDALDGGEQKDIPAGDVVNIARGESYSFKVNAPARLFELFNTDAHNIEIFINAKGYIDYRAEATIVKDKKSTLSSNMHPKL